MLFRRLITSAILQIHSRSIAVTLIILSVFSFMSDCSDDGGNEFSWTTISNPQVQSTGTLCIFGSQSGDVLLSTTGGSYYSKDHGSTWSAIKGLPSDAFLELFAESNAQVFFAARFNRLYRSVDSLRTWIERPHPDSIRYYYNAMYTTHNDVYLICGSSVYRSTNDGDAFSRVYYDTSAAVHTMLRDDTGRTYIGTDRGVVIMDGNFTHAFAPASMIDKHIHAIVSDGRGSIYAAGEGLWRSTNGGNAWDTMERPIEIKNLIAVGDGRLYATTALYYAGIVCSYDGGKSWTDIRPTRSTYPSNSHVISLDSAGYLYYGEYGEGLFRSAYPVK
jgi:photosystem II stability/assembly factor-like uncharacterized protein